MRLQPKLKPLDVEGFFYERICVDYRRKRLGYRRFSVDYRRFFVVYQRFRVDYRRFNKNGDIRFCGCPYQIRFLVLAIFILTVVICYRRIFVVYRRKRHGYERFRDVYRRIFVVYQRFLVDYRRFNKNGDIQLLWMSLSNQVFGFGDFYILTVVMLSADLCRLSAQKTWLSANLCRLSAVLCRL